jgi:hypothetical protein
LFIFLNSFRPYTNIEAVQVAVGVADGSLKLQLPRQKMSQLLFDILQQCFIYEPEGRPTFEKLV